MAIVKFISDKNFRVFIDMELAGKVTPDSMLKVTLECGSYLIQIKDEDGNLIMDYELEIKSSDNQLLQKIDSINNNLYDVIENLRNDPSLIFHCNRASFCHNGLYGFVDKKFNVVIPPIYYSVNEFTDDKAFVVRDFPEGRKTTMIDRDGNMFFNRWFDFIGESIDMVLLGLNDKIIVFSKKECKMETEYFNAGYDFKEPLVPAYKKVDNSCLYGYLDFDGKEVIPFIFDKVGNFDKKGKATISLFGVSTEIDKSGFYEYNYENDTEEYTGWKDDPEWVWNKMKENDYSFYPWDYAPYVSEKKTSWCFEPVWNKNRWNVKITIIQNGGQEKKQIKICDKVISFGIGHCICKVGEKTNLLIADTQHDTLIDLLFDENYIQPVLTGYDEYGGFIYPIFFIARKKSCYDNNSTFYIFNSEKKTIKPTQYEDIDTIILDGNEVQKIANDRIIYDGPYFSDRNSIYLRIKYQGRYGIIDVEGHEIIPPIYCDIILMGTEFFKVKNECGWYFGRTYKQKDSLICDWLIYEALFKVYNEIYDEILYCSEHEQWIKVFIVKKDNKYGCINNKGEIIVPVVNDIIKLSYSSHDPHPEVISLLIYKDKKVGYCDISYSYNYSCYSHIKFQRNDEYVNYVDPQFDECVLLNNCNSVLNNFYMHYAAVRKNKKWGILDQKPRQITYKAIDLNLADESEANYDDLIFKYDSLDELKENADNELKERYNKYYSPWTIRRDSFGDDDRIVEEGVKNEI